MVISMKRVKEASKESKAAASATSREEAERLASLNACDLEEELAWFARVVNARFKLYFGQEGSVQDVFEILPPDRSHSQSPYGRAIARFQPTFAERLALVLSLVPHLRPQLLDLFFTRNETFQRAFSEFGGAQRGDEAAFVPTGETLAFLLGANDLKIRFAMLSLFEHDHYFATANLLHLAPQDGEFPLKAPLRLSDEALRAFTLGRSTRPDFGAAFPARQIETALTWDDLVLHPATLRQVEEIETWLLHGDTLMNEWGMASKLRPGYRSLFYGPPGTGKTMTACLLGKATGRAVYRVDLSLMVSKYIGETEKNLAKVFDQAQMKGWILFFDEADSLFGRRSEVKDSHDRYANQEVSFLLQRIESFDSIAILASNKRENMDEAFARRFESLIFFPMPRPEERLRLWQQGFSARAALEPAIDLPQIAQEYTLSGGSIMNVIRYASLQALKNGSNLIEAEMLMQGIRREYAKEGKSV
jgi:hypothetical protein